MPPLTGPPEGRGSMCVRACVCVFVYVCVCAVSILIMHDACSVFLSVLLCEGNIRRKTKRKHIIIVQSKYVVLTAAISP